MPAKKKSTKRKPPKKQSENKGGRPKADIDKDQLEKLIYIGATDTEIGDFFSVHPTTISKRFSEILTKTRAKRKTRLRQMQWQLAEKGNIAMIIWLGKQELGQVETIKHEGIKTDPVKTMLDDVGKQVETNPNLKKKLDKELDD